MAKVTIYSTPTCPFCKMAKKFFKEHNIEYTDIDVSADQKAGEAMMEKTGQMGVPVIIIQDGGEEKIITGFDQEKISEILKLN